MRLFFCIFFFLSYAINAAGTELVDCSKLTETNPGLNQDARDCSDLLDLLAGQQLDIITEQPVQQGLNPVQMAFLIRSNQKFNYQDRIDYRNLDALLASILTEGPESPENQWRKAFSRWLESLKLEQYEQDYQWLINFLQTITPSEQGLRILINIIIGSLVLLSISLVIIEVYKSGFGWKKSTDRVMSSLLTGSDDSHDSSKRSIRLDEKLSAQDQIRVILHNVVHVLMEKKKFPIDLNMTLREMTAGIKQISESDAERFLKMVQQAEPVIYGNRNIEPQRLKQYRQEAEVLLGKAI